jgi:Tol biopolymer transport system component
MKTRNHAFKHSTRLLILLLILALAVSACTPTPTATPSLSVLPPLPTPEVPSPDTIAAAIDRWENSGNDSYYFVVEEKTRENNFLIKMVVKDGAVRAAQIHDRVEGDWSEPRPMPLEDAENFTAAALLARLQRDASGQGPAPLNMDVIFEPNMGFPTVINAEALSSYTEQGTVQLNREHSYTLVAQIDALIEEIANPGQTPVFGLTRSNGPEALCDSLFIYPNGSSQYSDDCNQLTLPLEVPASLQGELDALRAQFNRLEETRTDKGSIDRLQITGTGSSAPDPQTVAAAWELSDRLYELLSYPLGAGVLMLFTQNNLLVGMDMQRAIVQPSQLSHSGTLHNVAVTPDSLWIALSDDRGLRAMQVLSGETESLLAQPTDGSIYIPRQWNSLRDLLVTRLPADDQGSYELSLVNLESKETRPVPTPAGLASYGCDTGVAWSPDGTQLVVTGIGYGAACNLAPGAWLIDLPSGAVQALAEREIASGEAAGQLIPAGARNPAWSPDGEWIAFSMDEDALSEANFPSRIYVIHPDGLGLAPLTTNARGQADDPVWSPEGMLYYSLSEANTEENGIYRYDIATGESTRLIAGENLRPAGISPDGEFLAYYAGESLNVYVFLTGENLPETIEPFESEPPRFSGWLSPPGE